MTNFHLGGVVPRVWAWFPVVDTIHLPEQEFIHDLPEYGSSSPVVGRLRGSGFVDREAGGPFMSKRVAERLGYNFSYLGCSKPVQELRRIPGNRFHVGGHGFSTGKQDTTSRERPFPGV